MFLKSQFATANVICKEYLPFQLMINGGDSDVSQILVVGMLSCGYQCRLSVNERVIGGNVVAGEIAMVLVITLMVIMMVEIPTVL